RLSEVFGGGGRRGDSQSGGSLMPGLSQASVGSGLGGAEGGQSMDMGGGFGGNGGGGSGFDSGSGGSGRGSMSLSQDRGGASGVTLEIDGDRVGVSALDETNALLVRTTPAA